MKALITGATSGIGREMAKILAVRGVDLIIASRDEKKMKSLAKRLPVAVRTIAVDLSKAEDCYRLYDAVKAEEIDILINNAGFGAYGATWDVPLETELNMLDLNVRAVQILTKLFLADFRKRGSGRILNVASSAGFLAGPLMSGYYATKGYVLRLSEAISEELRQEVRQCAAEMRDLYRRGRTPMPKRAKRCNACSLKEVCLPGLPKLAKTADYLRKSQEDGPCGNY